MSYDQHYRTMSVEVNGKERTLCIPTDWLKIRQRAILFELNQLPVSPRAIAYVAERSLSDAVTPHQTATYLTCIDLTRFFHTITASRIFTTLRGHGYTYNEASAKTALVTYSGRLPFGAPTSPVISNVVFRPIDDEIDTICQHVGLTYTRYSDDMFFSSHSELTQRYVFTEIVPTIQRHGFQINPDKTRFNPKRVLGVHMSYTAPVNVPTL